MVSAKSGMIAMAVLAALSVWWGVSVLKRTSEASIRLLQVGQGRLQELLHNTRESHYNKTLACFSACAAILRTEISTMPGVEIAEANSFDGFPGSQLGFTETCSALFAGDVATIKRVKADDRSRR